MKLAPALFLALVTILTSVSAKDLLNTSWSGTAIKGYDPVAYFSDNKAIEGKTDFQSMHDGATYYFASK
jgi:hypothetical protein